MMWNQHTLLRNNALGNFRTMLQQITIDPAMLIYLDGDPSVVTAPNENYSREVMELFALGRATTPRPTCATAPRRSPGGT